MKISQDVLFFWLLRKFTARFTHRCDQSAGIKRPVFYAGNRDLSGYAVIIGGQEPPQPADQGFIRDALLICIGEVPGLAGMPDCSVITLDEDARPELVFNELQFIFEIFDDWDAALNACCNGNAGFQELIDCCEPVLFDPLIFCDVDFHFCAFSKLAMEDQEMDAYTDGENNMLPDLFMGFLVDPEFAGLYQLRTVFDYPLHSGQGAYKNVYLGDEYLGRIIVSTALSEPFGGERFRYYTAVLNHLAVYIERFYAKYLSFDQSQIIVDKLRLQLAECVGGNKIAPELWEATFSQYGWKRWERLQILQFKPNQRYDKNLYVKFEGKEIEKRWEGCVYFQYNDHFLLLVNCELFSVKDAADLSFTQALAYFLRDNLLVAGISRAFGDMRDLFHAYQQSEIAIAYGTQNDPTRWYHCFDDYALDYIVRQSAGPFEARQICSQKLLKLRQYDAENSTELYDTLLCYLQCRFRAVDAAKRLYIHRTSFINRMEKINQLVRIDFQSKDELLYILLSHRLLESS